MDFNSDAAMAKRWPESGNPRKAVASRERGK
jgi:hypothetical protein